ncbi:unnamed protein product [Eruca vesicaria subsp. sativa]|uniref:PsbP C-terminal domain-containing protein n=1 Tax=Eruca vesicaria subsp. sativa TaxID=29727 RepID=A0ABC8M0S7_ERUVS|nr:unnamed protein product [Eruca vesicaria subsp. sativa]
MTVSDNKDTYSFVYPFGWQEVVIEGQDKVYKDIIEPVESIAETLIQKVLAPPNQKTALIDASEHEVYGKTYYQFEFTAQPRNYTHCFQW